MNSDLINKFNKIRESSIKLTNKLSEEDCLLQYNPDSSPLKWQLGHTTWFFEHFILKKFLTNYNFYNDKYLIIFNSYYNNKGIRIDKKFRNSISRPSFDEVLEYRKHIDKFIIKILENYNSEINFLVELGLNHEQQHQELMLADIKSNFFHNPIYPIYNKTKKIYSDFKELSFENIDEGVYEIGVEDSTEFFYDIEQKRHKQYIHKFNIANRLVTNREYLQFIKDGGYKNFNLWHSDGWDFITQNNLNKPHYWIEEDGEFYEFELNGLEPLDLNTPVKHINYYEAWAFAKWFGMRLPTEFEWEAASKKFSINESRLLDYNKLDEYLEPVETNDITSLIGNCWQWTESSFLPYPGYKQDHGALGEYNGKFMVNCMVLRGGCSYTPKEHFRRSYRNFFYPQKRWMLSGIRLVK